MTEEQIKKFYFLCDSLDIRKFTPSELGTAFTQLKKEIHIGLLRKGEKTFDDGGLAAIDTAIKPITSDQLQKVHQGTKVLYGAYAGTNWVTGMATKMGKSVIEQHLVTKSFLEKKDRRFSSREDFAQMIGEQVKEAMEFVNGDKKIKTIAVSFGFAQIPQNTSSGRDAIVTTDDLTKSWYIRNGTGMLVGKYITAYLKKIGLGSIQKFYFANDTTAVALDVSAKYVTSQSENLVSLPCGFVMGTGDNGSAVFKEYKNDNLVNLEIGSAVSFGKDLILTKMMELKLTPTFIPLIEYYMGGDYLLGRTACAMLLLARNPRGLQRRDLRNDYFKSLLKYAQGAKITSRLAAKEITAEELSELLHLKVKADDLFILNEVAKRMMQKAGQVAGTMVSAVCELAGWGSGIKGAIPVEGTVFSQGFGFRETVRKTMKLLIPKHELVFVPGSGTRGIATEAMIRET